MADGHLDASNGHRLNSTHPTVSHHPKWRRRCVESRWKQRWQHTSSIFVEVRFCRCLITVQLKLLSIGKSNFFLFLLVCADGDFRHWHAPLSTNKTLTMLLLWFSLLLCLILSILFLCPYDTARRCIYQTRGCPPQLLPHSHLPWGTCRSMAQRNQGYQDKERYENFKELLEVPITDARDLFVLLCRPITCPQMHCLWSG